MKLVSLENLSKYNELLSQKTVRSVNSVTPDSKGNVRLGTEKSTFNKVVYDTGYFSIGTNATYNFDLTGSDLENVSKENVNIRLVAKVTTAHNGFEVGDIAQLTTAIDANANYNELNVCSYIRGNTLYVYSGSNTAFSVYNGTNWLWKANVQIKAVLTAFIPDDGSILLIAEDQTNTSKLIGLPDGTLTWQNKNLVRSVNGVDADASGNVTINAISLEDSWTDGYNGYRVYSDGFCEQWGFITETDNMVLRTVNLYKAYKDINYNINTEARTNDSAAFSGSADMFSNVQSIATTSFGVNYYETKDDGGHLGFYWRTCGYIR